jgi:hypothetical protein
MTHTFKVGDTIYVARAGTTELTRPCRVCNGDRRVTLILGTGEQVSLDCEYCAKGYEAPTGRETYYEYRSTAVSYPVTGIETISTPNGETVKYRSGSDGCYYSFAATDCFPSAEAAAERGAELAAEHEVEQERKMKAKEQGNKSYAWHAGYHLREAKWARDQAAYHERKAVLMKEQARTP